VIHTKNPSKGAQGENNLEKMATDFNFETILDNLGFLQRRIKLEDIEKVQNLKLSYIWRNLGFL
jgi:hypothetical protein